MSEQIGGGSYPGRYPAVVAAYDQVTRLCHVSIDGITDGDDFFPIAEIEYPLGDKSRTLTGTKATEIEMLVGDLIWVAFINGDTRYPIITGYRCPQVGNSLDWRRWHHKNMALFADLEMTLDGNNITITGVQNVNVNANTAHVTAPTVTVDSTTTTVNSANTTVNGSSTVHVVAPNITLSGLTHIDGDIDI